MEGRGPGWPTVLGLGLVALSFSVIHPMPLLMVPLGLMLIAVAARSKAHLGIGIGLLVLAFVVPPGPLWHVERGWTLLLGGWFVVALMARPGASFVTRAVLATGASLATAAGVVLLAGGWSELDWTMAARFAEIADGMARSWPSELADADGVLERAAELPARMFPALLAIASVAALGVGWWAVGRMARADRPLGRLRDFRFPDDWVWFLIVGLLLLLLPLAGWAVGWAPRVGSNVVLFMGALYALRGLAVLVAFVGPHVPALVVLAVVSVVLYPIVMAGTLVVGITDTWVDLRAARERVNEDG